MACGAKGVCQYSYRKGGNAVHCQLQAGGKWDFCKHQYLCGQSNRFELSKEADICTLPKQTADKMVEEANEAVKEAEKVIASEERPFKDVIKKPSKKKKEVDET